MTITYVIIALTCIISFLSFRNRNLYDSLVHYPVSEHKNGEMYRLLSSGFVHANEFHLFVNMFVLYQFGGMVEAYFQMIHGSVAGRIIFTLFYIFMIVLANLPTYAKHKDNPSYASIGASGATSAIVFSFIVFQPTSMLGLFFIIPIPAALFGILYLWYSSYASKQGRDNIDHDAHFYGAIAGFIFTVAMKPTLITDFYYKIISAF
jgi:membrane associated rhomboid family serine protease